MKITIDASCLVINPNSGLSEVVRNLISELPLVEDGNQFNFYYNYFRSGKKISALSPQGTANTKLRVPRRLVEWSWRFDWLPIEFLLPKTDIYHSLHIQVPPLTKVKKILTVHDCRFLAYPGLYTTWQVERYKAKMESSIKRADMVVTVSKFTRNEILNYFSIPKERIKVIYNGFNPVSNINGKLKTKADKFITENNMPRSYLFCIGALDPRKNIHRLIKAIHQCREESKDFPHLLIAGIDFRDWVESDLKMTAEKLGLSNHIHLCGVLEKDLLIGLMQKSYILCYPSLYEGFGFPPLEAMSLGIPVLAGSKSSIPEILGDSACLVDPESVEDIAKGLIKIVYDEYFRNNLVESGYQRINRYSWKKTAKGYLKVYRMVSDS
jgi:glycosyltransferase involved in cell wall biosynthesis